MKQVIDVYSINFYIVKLKILYKFEIYCNFITIRFYTSIYVNFSPILLAIQLFTHKDALAVVGCNLLRVLVIVFVAIENAYSQATLVA